ncbi:MAG: hypothetical protein Q4E53_13230 [Eubacteriales bacterium]|nr:hypothetical protein [Eubacteriales bacterium]
MGLLSWGNNNNGGRITTERHDGYTMNSGNVYENGRNIWVSEIKHDNGVVEGTRTDRTTGEVTHYRYTK